MNHATIQDLRGLVAEAFEDGARAIAAGRVKRSFFEPRAHKIARDLLGDLAYLAAVRRALALRKRLHA